MWIGFSVESFRSTCSRWIRNTYCGDCAKWDDKNAIDILRKKVEEVSYPLEDDRYTDESKGILNLTLNDDASADSDGDVEEL